MESESTARQRSFLANAVIVHCGRRYMRDVAQWPPSHLESRRIAVAVVLSLVLDFGAVFSELSDRELREVYKLWCTVMWGPEAVDACLFGASRTILDLQKAGWLVVDPWVSTRARRWRRHRPT